ncbi:hypothetical protein FOZ62_004199 [Perkinsus olseni]|uniref:Stress-response A/B barrel domain-containing protein n=1 Tax=Perkinsus olseni TaxID=32597 RepID=A0A7J6N7M0_PEROL|nr:hypothetical protein FOZ62_004199 [Perkinsus olseni]
MVAFKLKKDASEEAIQRLMDSCNTMREIPIVKDIRAHRDLGLDPERNHDMMFLVKFDSIEDYKAYSTHPVHMDIMRTILLPILEPDDSPQSMSTVTQMVSFKLKEGVSEVAINQLITKCLSMKDSIPVVKDLQVHRDLGLDPERNQNIMLLVSLDDVEDYVKYASNLEHLSVVENFIRPATVPGSRSAMQFKW